MPERGVSPRSNAERIAVIGLGYVGFPLSVALADAFEGVVGYDISERRVATLSSGHDFTGEISAEIIAETDLHITQNASDLARATVYIVTVPTPIDDANRPDFAPLLSACNIIGTHLKRGDLVVFESTVYPGVTQDYCGKRLSDVSGLVAGVDFNLGYSPERINPGDKVNTISKIVKIVAADTPQALDRVARIYEAIVDAGIYRASSIAVAEAAKVLENTQRDVNIALMNEMAIICDKAGISTAEVIAAASTKWNFVRFQPGLVGGHCIGVDPYYLASLSEKLGHHAEVILAARRVNNGMPGYVADVVLRKLVQSNKTGTSARIGVFGVTFKEDVPDIRNSKVFDLIRALQQHGLNLLVADPHVDNADLRHEGLVLTAMADMTDLDIMILAVPHRSFLAEADFLNRIAPGGDLIDVKAAFQRVARRSDIAYWSL